MSDNIFTGTIPALMTPCKADRTPDYDALVAKGRELIDLGMTAVVDDQGLLAGLFTDGDLRRILDLQVDIHHTPISRVMTVNCVTVGPEMMAAEAVKLMETRKINGLLVVDGERHPLGAFNMHDLLKAGVI